MSKAAEASFDILLTFFSPPINSLCSSAPGNAFSPQDSNSQRDSYYPVIKSFKSVIKFFLSVSDKDLVKSVLNLRQQSN